jgi:cytochrome oxidase Cu insertion factor (SCO1/SenC/PrrC family)
MLLLLGLAGCARDSTRATKEETAPFDDVGTNVGQKAPDISAEDVQGKPLKLSDYRGKIVVLEFWGVS